MKIEFIIYTICLFCSVFAVSGMNINSLFKHNHIFEARMFIILLIMSLTYLSGSLIISVIN